LDIPSTHLSFSPIEQINISIGSVFLPYFISILKYAIGVLKECQYLSGMEEVF
jgi:hypothetical protein